jgi:uncharacterized protein YndB with AHSA1/START domain
MLVDAHGPAHPDDVWRRSTQPDTWPTWAHLVQGVDATDDVLTPGTTGTVHGPAGLPVAFTVTAVDPELRSWSWTVGGRFAGPAMDHFVLPAPGGGTRAVLRVPGRSSALLQGYRLPATRALRRLVAEPGGSGAVEDVRSFEFAFAPSYAAAGRAFGITPATATVEVGPQWLYVGYGPWRLVTPVDNVASAEIAGGFAWIKTAGPPHLSLEDRGISFTTNGDRALCLAFHEPVPSIDPTATITHPGATLSVADPEGLAEALGLEL